MTYKLKYKFTIEQGDFTKEEALVDGAGACDALVFVSILRGGDGPHVGPKSIRVVTRDGHKDGDAAMGADLAIPNTELFQVMTHLAAHIADAEDAPYWQRELARQHFENARECLALAVARRSSPRLVEDDSK